MLVIWVAISSRVASSTTGVGGTFRIVVAVSGNGADDSPCHAQMWAALIKDLLERYGWSQSELSRRIGVSQQTISVWLSGGVLAPSIQTVHAVYRISGLSMLRLLSIAYGWPLAEIAQHAVPDAAEVDEDLTPFWRTHILNQYNALVRDSQAELAAGKDIHNNDDSGNRPTAGATSNDV
jgi:transcriptional regulator with XRE-family HTH domain